MFTCANRRCFPQSLVCHPRTTDTSTLGNICQGGSPRGVEKTHHFTGLSGHIQNERSVLEQGQKDNGFHLPKSVVSTVTGVRNGVVIGVADLHHLPFVGFFGFRGRKGLVVVDGTLLVLQAQVNLAGRAPEPGGLPPPSILSALETISRLTDLDCRIDCELVVLQFGGHLRQHRPSLKKKKKMGVSRI